MKSIFEARNYRKYLKSWAQSQDHARGLLSRMANAMACQNSHLTRVMNEDVHLTPDQAFAAADFMKLTEPEVRYFLKLVEHDRAAGLKFRERLASELKSMRAEQENLSKRFQNERLGHFEKEMTYYSSWFWSAIHILTDIPEYRTALAIAERLNLDERFVRSALQTLASFDLVKQQAGDQWKINSGVIHLPKTSPMNAVQHGNWRTQAVQRSQNPATDNLHYTIVQTVSRDDFAKIKQLWLEAIDRYRSIADKSPGEELICLTCDFFVV